MLTPVLQFVMEKSRGLSYVSVTGTIASNGAVLLRGLTTLSSGRYVPGVTPVYLIGPISEARPQTSEVVLRGAVVSFEAAELSSGRVIEILGTQPIPRGVLLPATVRIIEDGRLRWRRFGRR